ncbi:hypothetical protein FB45DRAFT_1032977 [Roridomyces roridus]|uniref:Transcription factor domain-containing protein n=1 Tax=Roridomyces roridus TaxID=1738132 RepID=A0AAD7FF60_9AGAR|nr:hypothetical protein FB45DRAFT_1032977 [Roridomyces roridus]
MPALVANVTTEDSSSRRKVVSTAPPSLVCLRTENFSAKKCDGARPICGPCSRQSDAFGDCEYKHGGGSSNAQMLEEQIAILQARIEELEKPKSQRLTLSAPHSSSGRGNSAPSGIGPLLSYFYSQQTSGTAPSSMPMDLPFIVLQALVHNFLHNATSFGFFLDTQAFHDAVSGPDAANTAGTLPPVLLNVLYLWGVHLSQDARITAYEPAFLAHALRSTASSLAGTHPRTVLHSAQASVLLAAYFRRSGRPREGRYHTSAAVAVVLSAGLHRVRSVEGIAPTAETLPPPRDPCEEGERIAAFWSVLSFNNCWAGADGVPSNLVYDLGHGHGVRVDTPWPLERTRDYVDFPHLLPRKSTATIARFLADAPDDPNSHSSTALYAKAGILFEAASHQRSGEFAALDRTIGRFISSLPAIQNKAMVVVHTLGHAACIQLHNPLSREHSSSARKAVSSARAIVDILGSTDIPKIGLIDPILAPLWKMTCFVLIGEVTRRRAQGAGPKDVKGPIDSLNVVISAMQIFAPNDRLMSIELESVRQAYNAAQIG